MKKRVSKKKLKKSALCSILLIILYILGKKYQQIIIYDNLDVTVTNKIFEYGNSINLKKYIKRNTKDYKYSIIKGLDTSQVGEQKIEVEVKYKGVSKVVPVKLNVVDTIAPTIEIKEENMEINEGTSIKLEDNVSNVRDNDENIEYKEISTINEEDNNYYTINPNGFDYNTPNEYTIYIIAVDKAGNKTERTFTIKVKKVIKPKVYTYKNYINTNAPLNQNGNDIVSIATSLVGSNYTYGGNTIQTGFDCSGFVQYVYSQVGKSVSRSAYTQAYDGVGIGFSEAEPGDIMSWGHNGVVTHSSIYIGNGQMVHAINENLGVIISNVNSWTNSDTLMAVRRVI